MYRLIPVYGGINHYYFFSIKLNPISRSTVFTLTGISDTEADDTLLSDSDCNMDMRARTLPVPALHAHTCAQVRIGPRNPTRPMANPARLMYHFVSYVPLLTKCVRDFATSSSFRSLSFIPPTPSHLISLALAFSLL
jgi:hypothetical protein